jgi:hypothetical protein
MRRLSALVCLVAVAVARGEQFDYYTYPVLTKAVGGTAKEVKEVSSDQLGDLTGALPDSPSAFLVVVTNDQRYAKLLVQPARQKVGMDKQAPLLLVDKFTTFSGKSERAVTASGAALHLYPGLRLNLDIGQVVPEAVPADLVCVASDAKPNAFMVKPAGTAKLYTVAAPIPGVVPKRAPKLVVGEAFEPRFFAGKFKLHDDGRRSGVLRLEVKEDGEVAGTFTSDKDGKEYEVEGKVGTPRHAIAFSVKFPATTQTFTGFMFTGDGRAIAGTSKMQDREAAFYAVRVEE